MIIGATKDSDYTIMKKSNDMYHTYHLKRVFYSAYVPINNDKLLPSISMPPLLRENRLYQADWLLRYYKFNGQTKWVEQTPDTENKQELIKYMLNAYRVLLTRARAGMVICVPAGNPNKNLSGYWEDSTRLPEFYDGTYQYLKSLGIKEI